MQHPYRVCLENFSKLVKHFVELKHDWTAHEIRCLLVLPHLVECSEVKLPLFGHEEVWSVGQVFVNLVNGVLSQCA